MELDYLFIPYAKINSKWTKELNVRPETIKLLKENLGGKLLDFSHSNIFFGFVSSQGRATKAKINRWYHIKLQSFCIVKETNKMERQPTEWEGIFANAMFDKGLISKNIKNLVQFNPGCLGGSVC